MDQKYNTAITRITMMFIKNMLIRRPKKGKLMSYKVCVCVITLYLNKPLNLYFYISINIV